MIPCFPDLSWDFLQIFVILYLYLYFFLWFILHMLHMNVDVLWCDLIPSPTHHRWRCQSQDKSHPQVTSMGPPAGSLCYALRWLNGPCNWKHRGPLQVRHITVVINSAKCHWKPSSELRVRLEVCQKWEEWRGDKRGSWGGLCTRVQRKVWVKKTGISWIYMVVGCQYADSICRLQWRLGEICKGIECFMFSSKG